LKRVRSTAGPSVRIDSRLVRPGDVFVALRGTVLDGHDFIDKAIKNGARYIVAARQSAVGDSVQTILVEDPAEAAALLAQASCGEPARKLTNLAVTGTNGKTTVAFLVRSVIQAAGEKCGLIGTVEYDTADGTTDAPLTTPDCLTIARAQKRMVESGAKFMVIEASSHALAQNRLASIDFAAAAFTNLTGDHLDYHKNRQNYLAAKTLLFERLSADATAVLNRASPFSSHIAARTAARKVFFDVDAPAEITARIESIDLAGTSFVLDYSGCSQPVRTALLGRHNVSNALAAAGLCLAAGFDLETIAEGISSLKAVPGRLEKVDADADFSVLIDYAHTDDALKNVLSVLKPLCKGSLTVVFGCGGDRDRTKRPRMAAVAEELADRVVVTSDNPRTEDPLAIIDEITAGLKNPRSEKVLVEPDRRKAIELAIGNARTDDIVLIAGKGHETYQIIGDKRIDFSDLDVARRCLDKLR